MAFDEDDGSGLPSLSWSSVVKERSGGPPSDESSADAEVHDDDESPETNEEAPTETRERPARAGLEIDTSAFSVPSLDVVIARTDTSARPAPPPVPSPTLSPTPSLSPIDLSFTTPEIGVNPPPAADDPTPDPAVDDDDQPVTATEKEPTTISLDADDSDEADDASSSSSDSPAVSDATPASIPRVEPVSQAAPQPAISLPAARPAPVIPVISHHQNYQTVASSQSGRNRGGSGGFARFAATLLVLAAVASAAVVFGRPYLFPEEWDEMTLSLAEPISEFRGVGFSEPVVVNSQVGNVHRAMVSEQLFGGADGDFAVWRAFGLAEPGSTDEATMRQLIEEQSPVMYSTDDGQIYYDRGFTRADREALITRALATASLDQEFRFSDDLDDLPLDGAAMLRAHVQQQSTAIQREVAPTQVPPVDLAALAFLPPVIDYELTAPTVFAELLPPVNDIGPNPLDQYDPGTGPGPLRQRPLPVLDVGPVGTADDTVEPVSSDRSFWYLTFAAHLDTSVAYQMSEDITAAALQTVETADATCAVATFESASTDDLAILTARLTTWVADSAPALGASVIPVEGSDTSVQLRSCDPVSGYDTQAAFGIGRQLVAWRAVELAVTSQVLAGGGSEDDVASAVARVGDSLEALAVTQLPAGTTPTDLADAARSAADAVISAGG